MTFVLASGKVQSHHRERWAVVYVRQSTLQQVARHQESTRLQYGLVDRALSLGWSPAQVKVIDEDLGKSAASAEGRPGFQRLVAAVSLEQVGIILGIEMSRLARSCRDWHQLLEVCAVFGSLIGDPDGVYDPRNYNDRLLLGLKGTMSEAELHVLKQRMLAGRRAKAERGELATPLPMGYVRRLSGEISKDPDEQAQGVIGLIFEQFERLGTLNGVLQYLVQYQIRLPHRIVNGPQRGELEWRRPNRATLSNLLHHPIYAGPYVYGRRPTDPRRQQPGRPAPDARWPNPRTTRCCCETVWRRTSAGSNSPATSSNWLPTDRAPWVRSAQESLCCQGCWSVDAVVYGWPRSTRKTARDCGMSAAVLRWSTASRVASPSADGRWTERSASGC